ncbi:MAG: hypothetical protein IIB37_14930, partial [Gemmatimonadetes bacterium]|nr:hypothetical protein [Gemmatimonadota bacterium]
MSGQRREFGWSSACRSAGRSAWSLAWNSAWGTAAGVSLLLVAFVCFGAPGELGAQAFASSNLDEEVTFTRDVAPILQENCVRCHRAGGGMAPMSLETYQVA